MTSQGLTAALRDVPLFSGLSQACVERLVEAGDVVEFSPRDVVFRQGDEGDSMYVLLSGKLRIYHEDSKRAIAVRGTNDFIGEIALFQGVTRTASAQAVTRVKAFSLNKMQLKNLLHNQPSLAMELVETISFRARTALERERKLAARLQEHNQKLERLVEKKTRQLREVNEQLREQNKREPLTNCYNRGYFQDTLAAWMKRQPYLSLIILDIDFFKRINDTHGHQAGDRVLIEAARLLESQLGRGQFLARYGGEEFVIVLSRTKLDRARRKAEEFRRAIESFVFPLRAGQPGDVTISLGVASYPQQADDPARLVEVADEALYRAKESGRNRVIAAG
ncbi:MAG: GGDEF domain-containing protein [Vulcanimicrobiota bacterium]